MPYCLYLRKSRADLDAEAHGEGETLARHEHILLDYAKRHSLTVTQIYREVVSGETISARPIMQQLLSDVEQGVWDGVLVVEVERLARGDTIDQGIVAQTFKYSGAKIITPMKVYDPNNEFDEEYFEFGLFMSRREYKTINRRLQRGRIESVKEGKYVGNKTPYGYTRKKLEREKGYTLSIQPEQSKIVQMIFSLYAYGQSGKDGATEPMGISKIVRKLNELGIPSPTGSDWVNSSVRQMLNNPVYAGKIRWNGRPTQKKMVDGKLVLSRPRVKKSEWVLSEGLHEALIDDKTWDIVQSKLEDHPSHPGPKSGIIKNPLSGLIFCGKCGRRMVRRPYTNRDYPDTLICAATSCDNISSWLDSVEKRVLDTLQAWLDNYKLQYQEDPQHHRDQIVFKKQVLKDAKAELKTMEKQRDSIYDFLEQGVYTTEVFLQRSQAADQKISDVTHRIEQIEAEIQRAENEDDSRKYIIPRAENVLKRYPLAETAEEKNALLKSVIDKAVYTKTVNGRWQGSPDAFELVLYPKITK